ncbi:MAG: gliding motility-associated C-terminal domain-containing protein, partial [Bacteroidales bacterium]|nr:gliding motility-associated C-terminal domain-containing protein [Bacteroidales bacterium]
TFEIPNIFTPNGDGINDGFHIKYNNRPKGFLIRIFTRSGQNIFSSGNCDFVWDGDGQNPGTYFYIINYQDTMGVKTISGNITLAQ